MTGGGFISRVVMMRRVESGSSLNRSWNSSPCFAVRASMLYMTHTRRAENMGGERAKSTAFMNSSFSIWNRPVPPARSFGSLKAITHDPVDALVLLAHLFAQEEVALLQAVPVQLPLELLCVRIFFRHVPCPRRSCGAASRYGFLFSISVMRSVYHPVTVFAVIRFARSSSTYSRTRASLSIGATSSEYSLNDWMPVS